MIRVCAIVAALVIAAMPVFAQAPSAGAGQSQSPSAPPPPTAPVTFTWNDGFVAQGANGDYRLQLGTVTQVDGRFSLDDPAPIVDTFSIRKARIVVGARVARYFDFRLVPDFGNGTTTVQDAYFDTRFSTKFRLRAGKDKTPIGYEVLISDPFLLFPERALASSLIPNRDVGFQAQGDLAGGKVTYSGGVFNGVPDGASSSSDVDTNGSKDLAGRIVVQPFRTTQTPASALSGLGVHLGGSTGKQVNALPSFRTSIGQTYFAYAAGASANGTRTRVTPTVFYYHGPFGAFGEYVRSTQAVARLGVTRDVTNQAWDVTGSYVLTGEAATDRGVRPRAPFDPANHHWGALQMLARYSQLTVDRDVFANALAAPGASRTADSYTLGVNWYPTTFIKWYATYERTVFDGEADGPRPVENAVLFRGQVAF